MDELKNCPFCGASAKKNVVHLVRRHDTYTVVCGKCGANGARIKIKDYATEHLLELQEQAKSAWNCRAT